VHIAAASKVPNRTARSDPAVSSTARTSSHASLERRRLARAIGQAGAAPVEEDEARERGDPVVEGPLERRLALDLDVAGEAVGEDDVRRPFPLGRVRDREVAALGVPELVARVHGESLCQIPRSG
jgi:hypothetical protein